MLMARVFDHIICANHTELESYRTGAVCILTSLGWRFPLQVARWKAGDWLARSNGLGLSDTHVVTKPFSIKPNMTFIRLP